MDTTMPEKDQWPAVDDAYGFVQPSYQLLMNRFEAADTRLTTLLTFSSTLTLAVPLFARSVRPDVSFHSGWFIGGVLLFLCACGLGLAGRLSGGIRLVNPMILYTDNLHKDPWTFKKDMLYRAGEHFRSNVDAVQAKGTYALLVTLATLLEVLSFGAWIVA